MRSKLLIIFIFGLLIRLIIAPFAYHSDVQTYDLAGFVMGKTSLIKFYDFLPEQPVDSITEKTFHDFNFNYPPAVYFLLGPVAALSHLFTGQEFIQDFLFNTRDTLGSLAIFIHLLTLKLPLLLFDFAIALLFLKIFSSEKEKLFALTFWMFNPVNLYATYFMGQFDIIPTFFTVLALFFVIRMQQKTSLYIAALSLGIGAAFKIYPLFFLLPLIALTPFWRERAKIFLLGILPYILSILPFLSSEGFRSSALVAGQTLKSFYAQIPISGGEAVYLFPALLVSFYILLLVLKIKREDLWKAFFMILMLFFIFTHSHPQWLLWITPFLITDLVRSNMKHWIPLAVILISWFGSLFFFDPGLTVGFFAPLFPDLYDPKSIWEVIGVLPDYNFARSMLQSIFVGSAIFYMKLVCDDLLKLNHGSS